MILTPTHKAKFVIMKKTQYKFACSTIHSFLGYARDIDENGQIKFIMKEKKDTENKVPEKKVTKKKVTKKKTT